MMLLLLEVLHAETSSRALWDTWLPIDPIMVIGRLRASATSTNNIKLLHFWAIRLLLSCMAYLIENLLFIRSIVLRRSHPVVVALDRLTAASTTTPLFRFLRVKRIRSIKVWFVSCFSLKWAFGYYNARRLAVVTMRGVSLSSSR